MAYRHTLFRLFYRVGFTPWDGHPQSATLRELIEGADALPPGSALDIGCGTGDASIYLARHGWQVTGVDFIPKALDKARAKARAADATVNFVHADVTHLSQAGIGAGFQMIVDNGCFHGMSDHGRDLYVHEVSEVAAPGARLFMVAFKPNGRIGPPGVDQAEIERRFISTWALLSATDEPRWTAEIAARFVTRSYLLQRRQ